MEGNRSTTQSTFQAPAAVKRTSSIVATRCDLLTRDCGTTTTTDTTSTTTANNKNDDKPQYPPRLRQRLLQEIDMIEIFGPGGRTVNNSGCIIFYIRFCRVCTNMSGLLPGLVAGYEVPDSCEVKGSPRRGDMLGSSKLRNCYTSVFRVRNEDLSCSGGQTGLHRPTQRFARHSGSSSKFSSILFRQPTATGAGRVRESGGVEWVATRVRPNISYVIRFD